MSILRTRVVGSARRTLVAAAVAGTAFAGALGGGTAAHAATNGIVVREQCTGVTGQISYTPGLLSTKTRPVNAALSATTTGCSDLFAGALAGSGSFTAALTGNASLAAENFSGTFTVNWPATAGLNPSNGTLTATEFWRHRVGLRHDHQRRLHGRADPLRLPHHHQQRHGHQEAPRHRPGLRQHPVAAAHAERRLITDAAPAHAGQAEDSNRALASATEARAQPSVTSAKRLPAASPR